MKTNKLSRQSYIYIITNEDNTIFYIGVTSDLAKRIYEHKKKVVEGFSKKHNLIKLVYYEIFDNIEDAIKREKQLKNWHRQWKINLIKEKNSDFAELYEAAL